MEPLWLPDNDKLARAVRLFFTRDHDCAPARAMRDARRRFGTTDEQRVLRGEPLSGAVGATA